MTDEERDAVLTRIDQFLFKDMPAGGKSRADQIDQLLLAVRTGKLGVRAFLWLCGALVVAATAWGQFRGFFGK